MQQPKEVVMGYQRALGSGDWKTARSFLKDDMKFKGPIAEYDRPEPYIEDLKRLHGIVKGVDMKKVFVDGDDVCLLYDMVTDTPAGTACICEWYHVDGAERWTETQTTNMDIIVNRLTLDRVV